MRDKQNTKAELDQLVGLTITGWSEVQVDYAYSFILLKTNSKFEDNKVAHILISQDAELNGGGYLAMVDKEFAKGLDY